MRFVYSPGPAIPAPMRVTFISETETKFWAFHNANPDVYAELVSMARLAKSKWDGDRFGFRIIWEALRWGRLIAANAIHDELLASFKLPNDFSSRYSRLIMEREADLAGFFSTRSLRS